MINKKASPRLLGLLIFQPLVAQHKCLWKVPVGEENPRNIFDTPPKFNIAPEKWWERKTTFLLGR